MKASQQLNAELSEKYHKWVQGTSLEYTVNHTSTVFTNGEPAMTARFRKVYDATIGAQVIDGGGIIGSVELTDPWFVDMTDEYGMRNRGTAAISRPVTYQTNNVGLGTSYKGVFLNQGGTPPNLTPPYYSVRTPKTQTNINGFTWHFQSWGADNANVTQPTNIVTDNGVQYYQSPVVFYPGTARTVTANYKAHLGGNNAEVTATGGQHKVISAYGEMYL